jgi:hypothetical protein
LSIWAVWLRVFVPFFNRLFGKRSASGRRHLSGSGGQATDPTGAVRRLVLEQVHLERVAESLAVQVLRHRVQYRAPA